MRQMINIATALVLVAATLPATTAAQGARGATTPVARRAAGVWNATQTTRRSGAFDLEPTGSIRGDVAVLNGPVTVAGTIEGSLVAINADVRLEPGARVDRDLIVIGGTITGTGSATLGGEILQQAELLRYHLEGETLQVDREPEYDDSWWRRHRIRREWARGEAYSDFAYVASRSYNRVEGWAFAAGPRLHRPTSWGAVNVEAFAIARTADPMRWDNRSVGHDAKAEVQFGKDRAVAIGARAFDIVQPTEQWQLGESEAGLAAAVLHRDYRDYYARHGGAVFAKFMAGRDADLTIALSDEQWAHRPARDPWSLTNGSDPWRANPTVDPGRMHLVTTRLRVDTREREASPFGGWYLNAELEQGGGTITRYGAPVNYFAPPTPEAVWYSRAMVDLRRYNRIAPGMSLDLRVAAGGWLAGDHMPTQRRLGLGGPGSLPGYTFRDPGATNDFLTCSAGFVQAGTPAQCDRVLLAQAQLRSRFLFGGWRDDGRDADWWTPGFNSRTSWVLFADAGRGWRVNGGLPNDPLYMGRNEIPRLSTFSMDVGGGIDFGGLGLYWAKALNNSSDDGVRFIVRLQSRF